MSDRVNEQRVMIIIRCLRLNLLYLSEGLDQASLKSGTIGVCVLEVVDTQGMEGKCCLRRRAGQW